MSGFSFGFENYASMLSDRIVDNLEDLAKPPLAIGIFGQWGSGKSTLLSEIYSKLNGQKINPVYSSDSSRPVVPVLFNAWRFEKEENLIILLLKTIYYSIQSEAAKYEASVAKNLTVGSDVLREIIDSMEIATPGYLSIDNSAANGIDEYVKFIRSREQYEAKYFNISTELSKFTEHLSIVFLIDDLDRCLPDNVLKTLESIKLFLDISGFAFVLAVDDDVVERGILHKYKDYGNFDNLSNLITGSEYLEKIISLPFKIPRIGNEDSRAFFLEHYPELFARKVALSDNETEQVSGQPNDLVDEELLALFVSAVPPVPRRLIRAAELYKTKMDLIQKAMLGILHSNRIIVAKLVFLELFAPSLFRFGCYRRQLFFSDLTAWKEKYKSLYETDKIKKGYEKSYAEGGISQEQKESYDHLLRLVSETNNGRNGFKLDVLFRYTDGANADDVVKAYLQMSEQKGDSTPKENRETADIADLDGFVIDILSDDAQARKSAFSKSEGKILSEDIVLQIAARLNDSRRVFEPQWWREMDKITDANGWTQLVNKVDIVKRLGDEK